MFNLLHGFIYLSRDVVFDEQSMLNRSEVTDLSETEEGSTSERDKIQLEMALPNHSTVSPGSILDQEEPGYDNEEEVLYQGGAHVYNIVRGRAPYQIQPLVRYEFEELAAYA